jgi:hypothetical protein
MITSQNHARPRLVGRVLLSAVLLTASLGAASCGGGASGGSNTPVDLTSLPPAPDLGVLIEVKGTSAEAEAFVGSVQSTLSTSMTNAGYKLVTTEGAAADVIARITVAATEETSFFQMQVNGKVQKSYKVTVNASFISASDNSVVDQTVTEFSGDDGQANQNALDKILVHLGKTRKLDKYASTAKANAEKAEEDLWGAANVEACRKGETEKSCEGVKAYIEKYPSGKHTADARKAMTEGETNSVKNAEEKAWSAAAVDICLKPTKSYDCQGVEAYIKQYPTGAHVAEGKDAMKKSEKTREALAKTEAAKKKQENREECVKDCRRSYERAVAFEVLVARCVQTECG